MGRNDIRHYASIFRVLLRPNPGAATSFDAEHHESAVSMRTRRLGVNRR